MPSRARDFDHAKQTIRAGIEVRTNENGALWSNMHAALLPMYLRIAGNGCCKRADKYDVIGIVDKNRLGIGAIPRSDPITGKGFRGKAIMFGALLGSSPSGTLIIGNGRAKSQFSSSSHCCHEVMVFPERLLPNALRSSPFRPLLEDDECSTLLRIKKAISQRKSHVASNVVSSPEDAISSVLNLRGGNNARFRAAAVESQAVVT